MGQGCEAGGVCQKVSALGHRCHGGTASVEVHLENQTQSGGGVRIRCTQCEQMLGGETEAFRVLRAYGVWQTPAAGANIAHVRQEEAFVSLSPREHRPAPSAA
eukprot:251381-Rhodomonas_salina.2